MTTPLLTHVRLWKTLWIALVLVLSMLGAGAAQAQSSPLHPTFPLLDAEGVHVLESGKPLSTMTTCGTCHDTDYIATHNFHADAGLESFTDAGSVPGGLPWEMSGGLFGGWDPLTYRYLTPAGDALPDLGTPDWLKLYGPRHVGGGPAQFSPDGTPLGDLAASEGDPQTNSFDATSGEATPWEWSASGTVEMNCFLCHLAQPNLEARAAELQAGNFAWANTATLLGSGLVTQTTQGWQWQPDAFTQDGNLVAEFVTIQDPSPEHCSTCHNAVHTGADPLTLETVISGSGQSLLTGQIFSGQRMAESGLNLASKTDLTRSWDVHAERNLQCSNCHFAINNPIYFEEPAASRPSHLLFDPRRLDFGEYLLRPDHNFAKGQAVQHTVALAYQDSMRRCESCHTTDGNHDWLPYTELHLGTLSCESCHIPKLNAPALAQNDWTVITPEGSANLVYRGVEGELGDVRSLISGYEPVLLERNNVDGDAELMPFNLVTSFYWVHGTPERPVRLADLKAVYLDGASYQPDVLAAFDTNQDGTLDTTELRLDAGAKVDLIRGKLVALGLDDPRIRGTVQPYSINHGVVGSEGATRECKTCHNEASRISQPLLLASYTPGGVQPEFIGDANVQADGELFSGDDGALLYRPATASKGLYLPGHNRVDWVGIVGLVALGMTLALVVGHGGMRVYTSGRQAKTAHHQPEMHKVYMYSFYERLWHWLQAITILLLLLTGIVIHRPDTLGGWDLGLVVPLHNVMAFILVANAIFSAFYHFASGEIRQYLPEPHGYFTQALKQFDYYARGIFRGDPHPFQKTPDHKMNPLQQATYLVILNVLLPLQILTGSVMWGAQHWPELTAALGGLAWLAPFHTLIAWLFASFIVLHIYLTTTGHTPLANIQAMTVGWEEVEEGEPAAATTTTRPAPEAAGD